VNEPQVIAAIITASVTLAGAVLTLLYSLLKERFENKRHNRQLELEERRAKLDERRLAIELHNERELKIFEARLESYRNVFAPLRYLEKRAIDDLSSEKAVEVERLLRNTFYVEASHSLSANSIEAITNLRDSLIAYSKGKLEAEKLRDIRLELLRSLHRDLGRTGFYLGDHRPLMETDSKTITKMLSE
jgi:uncharacterized membrane-anchored protein YhcB (DUF1043 family)